MNAVVNVNGRIGDAREPLIPVFDHGFLYGEGVYETLRTYNRVPFLADRHLGRLRASAQMIALPVPLDDGALVERVEATMAALPGSGEAYIRILVTRGVGDLSYDLSATPTPSVVIIVKPFVGPPARTIEHGITVATVSVLRNHPSSVNPLIKSNNLLNNALAMQEAIRKGAEEAVMCNYRGELAECSQSNLFIVRGGAAGAALTPPLDAGLLPGITRAFVFEIGREIGVPVADAVLRLEDLLGADEAFVTGTTRELTPVVRVDDRVIGIGKPGPITKRLLETFHTRALELVRRPQPQH